MSTHVRACLCAYMCVRVCVRLGAGLKPKRAQQ